MQQKLAAWFKYQTTETRMFKEAAWIRTESQSRFNMQRIDLLRRKEKLFKSKDVSTWGCPPEKLAEAMEFM
jgi:hypothetical protein